MKIFVLGRSGSGKTPFARKVSEATGWQVIGASEWIKIRFKGKQANREAYIREITEFSIRELGKNIDSCVNFIKSKYDLSKPCIIEGIRNPHDFASLYNPAEDTVVFLDWMFNPIPETGFERIGLRVVRDYLNFLCGTGILAEDIIVNDWQEAPTGISRVYDYKFDCFFNADLAKSSHSNSLENIIQIFLAERLPKEVPNKSSAENSFVHAEIKPLKVNVRREFLFNMNAQYIGQFEEGTAFAISSYPGSAPTFKVMLDNGSVFSYLPPHALVARDAESSETILGLEDLAYHDCPISEICVSYFDFLSGPLSAYLKKRNLWMKGSYILTVDWYTGNDLLHLIELENGQLAFLPHHKIKFKNSAVTFPPYKKLKQEWSVDWKLNRPHQADGFFQ